MAGRRFKQFELSLTTPGPLFVGGPPDPMSEFHSPVARLGGKAVIPGTSLKGAMRAELEHILIEEGSKNNVMKPCIPLPRLSEDERALVRAGAYRGGGCKYGDGAICPACYFFGCQSLPGFLMVPYLEADRQPEPGYAAARDRATGAVHHGANRNVEVVPPGTTFRGVLRVLIEDRQRRWKLGEPRPHLRGDTDAWLRSLRQEDRSPERLIERFVLQPLRSLCLIGGKISTGHGWVGPGAIQVTELKEVVV